MASTARSLRYALAILTTSLVTPSVWAHAHLTHQYPAANAQVTAAPQAITLNQKQLIVPLADSLKPGTYTVDWHVVSVDGHKTKGHYTFSVK